jgi:hypothetical protein
MRLHIKRILIIALLLLTTSIASGADYVIRNNIVPGTDHYWDLGNSRYHMLMCS